MKLLLDTNVLLDYYALREPFATDALKLRVAAYFEDVELWACSQSFADIEYILRRSLPVQKLRGIMAESLSFLNICAPSASDVKTAIESDWPDLEDRLIAASAERIKADYLITRDERGFLRSKTRVLSPHSFLEMMRSEKGIEYADIEL